MGNWLKISMATAGAVLAAAGIYLASAAHGSEKHQTKAIEDGVTKNLHKFAPAGSYETKEVRSFCGSFYRTRLNKSDEAQLSKIVVRNCNESKLMP
ncbi:hypothetical protein LQT97_00540 [Brucella pseudogrignonensis]|uniref:hypothetical protein n=1 Tax=Brucella pseudogrignonensis TaxID=419475 RepID=UPI001E595D9B|nr:hypothetical protein [Brucella pseudogrignonensis]MCD4509711.1 hypothetical protein [Brucella pseudogrignonensis]